MKITTLFAALVATIPLSTAHPGMEEALKKIAIAARGDTFSPNQLIGDLRTLSSNQLTVDGQTIKAILQGQDQPQAFDTYDNLPRLDSSRCRQETCCVWKYISEDLQHKFRGCSGRCTKWARKAIRMGFHDAGTWSLATETFGGGADGSIILADELSRRENSGLGEMGALYQQVYDKYHTQLGFRSVTMADLIQMGATIATVVCPLGPRVRSWVGRKDSARPSPQNLMPSPFADAESLIQLFKDKTISPHGLIALLGAHTASKQTATNLTRAGDPQDTTPGVLDTLYYQETLGQVATPSRVYMFPSDLNLARHPVTRPEFQGFAGLDGQSRWNQDFAREYIRLSLLGVNNINDLQECTKVLPNPTRSFTSPDQPRLSTLLDSDGNSSDSKETSDETSTHQFKRHGHRH